MNFLIKALDGVAVIEFELAAAHQQDAIEQAKAKGYVPISALPSKAIHLYPQKHFPLSLFSTELLTLLDAGLNLVEAIEALAFKDDEQNTKPVLMLLLQSLQEGKSFSVALEQQSHAFSVLYIATVKASEKTGDLPKALARYIAYDSQLTTLKKKIISASIYPMLLMSVGGLVILFLMGFVVPKFSRIYEGTGGELPFLSQVLLSWGTLLSEHGESLLVMAVIVLVTFILLVRHSNFKRWIVKSLWQIPAIGKHMRMYQLSRFYRTLGMLLNGGTSILLALQSVNGLLDVSLQRNMQIANTLIGQGKTISAAMEEAELTTPIAMRMLMVGERGGNIGHMMERIASFYDEELARWIEWFTRLFEPILMLFIGLVIGLVVLLLYMPIFELAGQIQ